MPRQIARLKAISGVSRERRRRLERSRRASASRVSVAPQVNASHTYAASSSIGASSRSRVAPRVAVGSQDAAAIEVDVARRRPRDAAADAGSTSMMSSSVAQPGRQVGRADQQRARALAVALVDHARARARAARRAPRSGPRRPSRRPSPRGNVAEQVVLPVRRDQAVQAAGADERVGRRQPLRRRRRRGGDDRRRRRRVRCTPTAATSASEHQHVALDLDTVARSRTADQDPASRLCRSPQLRSPQTLSPLEQRMNRREERQAERVEHREHDDQRRRHRARADRRQPDEARETAPSSTGPLPRTTPDDSGSQRLSSMNRPYAGAEAPPHERNRDARTACR